MSVGDPAAKRQLSFIPAGIVTIPGVTTTVTYLVTMFIDFCMPSLMSSVGCITECFDYGVALDV